jgi:Acetyltransferase (GNAT) domain
VGTSSASSSTLSLGVASNVAVAGIGADTGTGHIIYPKRRALPIVPIRLGVRVAEFYFSFMPPEEECDIYAGLCLKEPRPGWSSRPRASRIIDLEQSQEALFKACSKNTRYEITRAERRDEVQTAFLLNSDERGLLEFVEYYDSFAATKNVPPVRRDQFMAMARARRLLISTARTEDGSLLAAHAYFLAQNRARLTHSASLFRLEGDSSDRRRLGRVNRLLHWDDIRRFRELGVRTYDMGGWYTGNRNQAQLRINDFKQGFGGSVLHEWDVFRPGSARGWLYLRGRNLVMRGEPA